MLKIFLKLLEIGLVPDAVVRAGARQLISQRLEQESQGTVEEQNARKERFISSLKQMPIAINTRDANEQHYEIETEFFQLCLGKNMKYSCCFYPSDETTLDEAEDRMLELTVQRAAIEPGMSILELGCGWGSLTLYMAQRFPSCKITAVSNSASQRAFIEERCKERHLDNVTVITCDINNLELEESRFDLCVSIEMFEHMKNYQKLLKNISTWLKPNARLFVHIFSHRSHPYHFETDGDNDWMAATFFTGGTMPSHDLLMRFQEDMTVEQSWIVNGVHYARTSRDWLAKLDANKNEALRILAKTYSENVYARFVDWRLFYIAVEEFFGYDDGQQWIVSHYLFRNNK